MSQYLLALLAAVATAIAILLWACVIAIIIKLFVA
jgi:hypothetical protein